MLPDTDRGTTKDMSAPVDSSCTLSDQVRQCGTSEKGIRGNQGIFDATHLPVGIGLDG